MHATPVNFEDHPQSVTHIEHEVVSSHSPAKQSVKVEETHSAVEVSHEPIDVKHELHHAEPEIHPVTIHHAPVEHVEEPHHH